VSGSEPSEIRPRPPDFGRALPEHVPAFLGIMTILHSEAVGPAFGRLLRKRLEPDDYVQLAHVFEEISVLALNHLIPEALLYDGFAFDLYWDEVREDVLQTRAETGNEKFCENFELAAERARAYRADRPPKLRWRRGPDEPPGGYAVRPPHDPPPKPAPDPKPVPAGPESRG